MQFYTKGNHQTFHSWSSQNAQMMEGIFHSKVKLTAPGEKYLALHCHSIILKSHIFCNKYPNTVLVSQ